MQTEYLVLEAFPDKGPLANVRSRKLAKSWQTLQEALDELGPDGWDINTCIYGPTGSQRGQFCEAFILSKPS